MPTGISAHARTPAGAQRVAALAATFLFGLSLAGCDRVKSLVGRGGADLSRAIPVGQEFTLRSLIEAPGPDGTGGTRIDLTIKCKAVRDEGDGWAAVEGEVTAGRYEVDGNPRQVPLAGQKAAFKYNAQRKMSGWQRMDFPSGLELLDIAPPKGRMKVKESWKTEGRRTLLVNQEEVTFERVFVLEGEAPQAGEPAWRMTVRVPAVKKSLASGAALEFSGTGEVWVARKDGRLLKVTEVLEGTIKDDKSGKPPARFTQAMTLADAQGAPAQLASAARPGTAAAPASGSATAPAAAASAAPSAGAGAAPAGAAAERLTFVSRATGRPEVWSVLPDGAGKKCLTPLAFNHWNPAPDPEGRLLAVVSARNDGINIWSVDLLSGNRVPMTEFGEREAIQPGWASGGKRLAFARGGKLWTVHRDGFNLASHPLAGRVISVATSPASPLVAVVINELNQNKIFTVDIQSGVIHELFEGEAPAFSPDGLKIAYRTEDALFLANSDGSSNTQLVKGRFEKGPIFWHPKLNRIGCTQIEAGAEDVYLLDAVPNTKLTRVTKRGGIGMVISPAGDKIAYLRHGDLWVASADGTVHTQLTADGSTEGPISWMKHHVP